jgi:uncharacterized membrane-anchored protein YjiN (DUF445 family)
MRIIATGLLGLMAALFLAASLGQARWPALGPALGYVRAFAEAGVVGACADWFAVTALFRRPFGLPIPHTAVIPRNKLRIGEALGGFIADNFLTEQVLDEKLRQLEVGRWGGDWLSRPENAARLARSLADLAPEVLAVLPKGALQDLAGAAALAAAKATPAAPLAASLLKAVWSGGEGQLALEQALERLGRWLAEHREQVRDGVVRQAKGWIPRLVDQFVADKVIDRLIQLLQDMRDPAHPWRERLRVFVDTAIERLASDPEWRAAGERLKLELLADPRLHTYAQDLWAALEARLAGLAAAGGPELAERLQRWIQAMGAWLREDAAVQARLNGWVRPILSQVIAPRRQAIGRAVAQVVAGWDARSVVGKLELQVGRDLQYIRINGTLVGGLTGLAMFALAHAVGLG